MRSLRGCRGDVQGFVIARVDAGSGTLRGRGASNGPDTLGVAGIRSDSGLPSGVGPRLRTAPGPGLYLRACLARAGSAGSRVGSTLGSGTELGSGLGFGSSFGLVVGGRLDGCAGSNPAAARGSGPAARGFESDSLQAGPDALGTGTSGVDGEHC